MPRKPTNTAAQATPEEEPIIIADGSAPQTDPENAEIPEGISGIQPDSTEETPLPQTDPEVSEFAAEGAVIAPEIPDEPPESLDAPVPDEGTDESEPASHQTEPEAEQEDPEINPDDAVMPENAPVLQTDIAPDAQEAKKPRRRAAKSQSATGNSAQPETPARRRRARSEPVLSIDEQRSVETQSDKLKSDLLDLVESQKGRKILSGTIQGVERSADNPNNSFAVIYHGAFKVIIPANEAVQQPEDLRDRSPADVMHYLITKRLGAEVDYIVKGVDASSGIAAASRLEAMALKRRQYYFGSDRDGNNLIYEDLSAEARVVSVIRAGMFVDLFGLEVYIPLRELSYQRLIDAAAHFQPGQRVLVKILKLDRSDRDNIKVSASVKQAGENPYEQALKKYVPGSRYVGTVSLVDTNGVFVSLDGGIDCLCTYPKRGRPPRGSRVTVRILGVNHESNRIWGAITHMTTAR
jgi:predicted RNA-binding protein with RPS1 domain